MSDNGHPPGLTVLEQQLAGIERWHAFLQTSLTTAEAVTESRESRTEARHRMESLRRAHAALLSRADAGIQDSRALLAATLPTRSVVVHRNAWWRTTLAEALAQNGVAVVVETDDGADGLGAAVAEQPDLLVVEHRLPSVPGEVLVQAVRDLAPRTVVAAQVDDRDAVPLLLELGVSAVFSRRVPPAEVAKEVVAVLRTPGLDPRVLV